MSRNDELSRMVAHLEKKAPHVKGTLCGNPSCSFYIGMLCSAALKETCRIPVHSCISFSGPCGDGDDFEVLERKARVQYAEELKRRHPQLFEDM